MTIVGSFDLTALASELIAAYADRRTDLVPPSGSDSLFDLPAAYAVEKKLVRIRRERGHTTVGRKVGYANKAMWRALRLETLAWAHMYDDTVHYAADNSASLSIDAMCAPKIEPEVVFKLASPIPAGTAEPAAILEAVEWYAVGFEIIDCVFVDWKFQPADCVASFGLHAGLVIGEPRRVGSADLWTLADQLARFKVQLGRDGEVVAEGSGRNVLRSPALCLGELASATTRQAGADPLRPGELVSSGTLTESHFIKAGQAWTVRVDGLDAPVLTLRI